VVSNAEMRVCAIVVLTCFVAFGSSDSAEVAPQIIYGTYLGGRHKECATAIAVDGFGNAYVAGRTPSPDFPVTAGTFSTTTNVNNDDWTGFVSKISEHGDQLLYSTFLGGNYRSSANAIAVDAKGRALVVGSTCSSKFPTTASAILRKAPGSDKVEVCDGFVAWLDASGSRLDYGTYLGGSHSEAATTVALGPGENVVYIGGYTSSPDFPVTSSALQTKLLGPTNGFISEIDVQTGKLLYSTYLGGSGNDRVTRIVVAKDGEVFVAGVTNSIRWPDFKLIRFGEVGATDGFILRVDPSGKLQPAGIRIGGSGDESLAGIDLDSHGDIYAVGTTDSPNFPVKGMHARDVGSGFVLKINGRKFGKEPAGVAWSRRIGGHGEDALLSVSARMSHSIFVSGRSGSRDFPATRNAIYKRLEVRNDSILAQLRGYDGEIQYATLVGGTRHPDANWYNDEATGVFANNNGDVYVTGCTVDDRLPVTPGAFEAQRKGNADAFILRMRFAARQQAVQSDKGKKNER
jgi:hypothetical protein